MLIVAELLCSPAANQCTYTLVCAVYRYFLLRVRYFHTLGTHTQPHSNWHCHSGGEGEKKNWARDRWSHIKRFIASSRVFVSLRFQISNFRFRFRFLISDFSYFNFWIFWLTRAQNSARFNSFLDYIFSGLHAFSIVIYFRAAFVSRSPDQLYLNSMRIVSERYWGERRALNAERRTSRYAANSPKINKAKSLEKYACVCFECEVPNGEWRMALKDMRRIRPKINKAKALTEYLSEASGLAERYAANSPRSKLRAPSVHLSFFSSSF